MATMRNVLLSSNFIITLYFVLALSGVTIITIVLLICIKKKKNPSVTVEFTNQDQKTEERSQNEPSQIVNNSDDSSADRLQNKNPAYGGDNEEISELKVGLLLNHTENHDLSKSGNEDELNENSLKSGARPTSTRSPVNASWYESSMFQYMDTSTDNLDKI